MEVVGAKDTAELFIATCERLRKQGAVSVKGLGFEVHFERPVVEVAKPEPKAEDPRKLSPEAMELQDRAKRLAGGV